MKPAYKKYVFIFWTLVSLILISIIAFFILLSQGVLGYMPSFADLENPRSSLATDVYSADGQILGKFYVENRSQVDFEDLSPHLVHALVDTEDERFYEHSGIDIRSLFRVLVKTAVLRNKDSGGGSTITQQLAKMLFHDPASGMAERVMQKFNEWVIAAKLERSYTKNEIIAMYLNRVGFVYDAYGIESASYTFFGKKVADLRVEEAAVLVGMLKNPALYNPVRRNELTLQRRNVVLGQMLKQNHLTQAQFDSLRVLPLTLDFRRADHKDGLAPYLREYIRLQMKATKPDRSQYASWQQQDYIVDSIQWVNNPIYGWVEKNVKADGSKYDIYRDGLKIYTTIDSRMQRYAEEAMKEHVGLNLQPQFTAGQKGKKYPPYSNDITAEQYESMIRRALRNSDRWRKLKAAGLSENKIMDNMKKPVETKVFDWNSPTYEVDTIMSPYDSVVYHKHFLRAGFMAMDPRSGHVKAYVGGPNFRFFQYDMVGKGRRQVGSTIKPFVYAKLFSEAHDGVGYTPCDMAPNSPQTFVVPAEGNTTTTWTPRNAGDARLGEMVSLKWGLANSNNNVTAYVMQRTSPQQVANLINALGVTAHIDPVPSLFLGTSDIMLLEMVGAYATFVNKGIHIDPIVVDKIEDKYGNVITKTVRHESEPIDEQTAYMMVNLLQGVVDQGTARRLRGPAYKLTCQIGGKTGTTQNNSDGWFMSILPHLVCGSWVGGEERAIHFNSMSLGQGSNSALPVFGRFILKVFADESITEVQPTDVFEAPNTINFSLDCSDKGVNADEGEAASSPDDSAGDATAYSDSQHGTDIFNF